MMIGRPIKILFGALYQSEMQKKKFNSRVILKVSI